MRFNETFKHPRLHTDHDLIEGQTVALNEDQLHYLKNVMRREDGDTVRVFNGRDGEWLSTLTFESKKKGIITPNSQYL